MKINLKYTVHVHKISKRNNYSIKIEKQKEQCNQKIKSRNTCVYSTLYMFVHVHKI